MKKYIIHLNESTNIDFIFEKFEATYVDVADMFPIVVVRSDDVQRVMKLSNDARVSSVEECATLSLL